MWNYLSCAILFPFDLLSFYPYIHLASYPMLCVSLRSLIMYWSCDAACFPFYYLSIYHHRGRVTLGPLALLLCVLTTHWPSQSSTIPTHYPSHHPNSQPTNHPNPQPYHYPLQSSPTHYPPITHPKSLATYQHILKLGVRCLYLLHRPYDQCSLNKPPLICESLAQPALPMPPAIPKFASIMCRPPLLQARGQQAFLQVHLLFKQFLKPHFKYNWLQRVSYL